MFKFDQIKSMFNCKLCSKLLVDPVTIPCGSTVCQSHLKEFIGKNTYECPCCNKQHSVPNEGFVTSEFIQKQLKMQLNSIDISPVYEDCKIEIEGANKNVAKIEELSENSENHIYNYFEDLKRQVDLRREKFKDKIDKYSNEVIQSINETQANCPIKLSKETTELKTKIDNSKKKLNELIDQFDILKIDEKKIKDIKEQVVTLNEVFKDNFIELKLSFHKEYSFIYDDQPMADVFGIFTETICSKINSIILDENMSIKLLKLCEFPVEQKWDLLYQATKDGFDSKDFHSKCDGKKNTLTIIKATNGNIFGGYTAQAWDSTCQWYTDQNTFIFSLVNKVNKPFMTKLANNSVSGICCDSSNGPIIGSGNGNDFYISPNSNTNQNSYSNFGHTYKHPDYQYSTTEAKSILAGASNFQTVEIEVFSKIY